MVFKISFCSGIIEYVNKCYAPGLYNERFCLATGGEEKSQSSRNLGRLDEVS